MCGAVERVREKEELRRRKLERKSVNEKLS
jgi:hypothetical protein